MLKECHQILLALEECHQTQLAIRLTMKDCHQFNNPSERQPNSCFKNHLGMGLKVPQQIQLFFQLFGVTCRSLHATGSHLPTSAITDERMQSISITALKECHQAGFSCHWKSAICNQFERLPCSVSGHIFVLVHSTKLKLDTCIYMWVCMYLNSMTV